MQAARYAQQWLGPEGVEQGRSLYAAALGRFPADRGLWDAAIAFEAACTGPDRAQRVLDLYSRAAAPALAAAAAAAATSSKDGATAANGTAAAAEPGMANGLAPAPAAAAADGELPVCTDLLTLTS